MCVCARARVCRADHAIHDENEDEGRKEERRGRGRAGAGWVGACFALDIAHDHEKTRTREASPLNREPKLALPSISPTTFMPSTSPGPDRCFTCREGTGRSAKQGLHVETRGTFSSSTSFRVKTFSSSTSFRVKTFSSATSFRVKTFSSATSFRVKTFSSATSFRVKTLLSWTPCCPTKSTVSEN